MWDIFFSYRRHDLAKAQPLLEALSLAGVRVWRDERGIPDQASVSAEIRRGIANSKALLAFYSRTYPLSNPCRQEITAAWLAAEQIDHVPNRRVWIVNPEGSFEHLPKLLRDQQSRLFLADDSQLIGTVRAIKDRLDALDSTLLGNGVRDLPAYRGMIPIQAVRFVGRETELWDLHAELTANRLSIITGVYGQAVAQVRGLGGNGKSLLAREYSIRFGTAYPGGVFWLNAYGHDDTKGPLNSEERRALREDQIRTFAVRCGLAIEGLDMGEIEACFWQALEDRRERCLWIVDDVPSGLSPSEMEDGWYARWAGASTLVTTRSKEYGALGNILDLGVLSPGEAFDLIRLHRQPVGSAEELAARRIIELLGCHPLAVEVAGSYLAQGLEGFQHYLDALENPVEDAVEFGNLLQDSLPTGHERSISTTLLRSIRQLGPEGHDFLRLASVLAVTSIPVSLIAEVLEFPDSGRSRTLAALGQAETLSLCEREGDDARTIHTLVSRTMRFQFPSEERTRSLRSTAVQVLTRRLQVPNHIGEYSNIAMDMPHARRLAASQLQTGEEVTLALWVARCDFERADYFSARIGQERALAACRRVLAEEDPLTLTAMHSLALTLYAQGDLSGARKLQKQVLEARRRVLGEEHSDTLRAMSNLGQTLHAQGDLSGARKLMQQDLEASRQALGDDHPDTLTAMGNLAVILVAQGDLAGARKLQEQVLEARRRVLGDEHPGTLTTIGNLAQTLHAQGDLSRARKLQEQVLEARRRLQGEEHPDTLLATNNIAGSLLEQGDLSAARKLQEQVLVASRRLQGEEHPDTLGGMHNLALTLEAQGDLSAARKLQEQVLEARRRLQGEEHPETLVAVGNLAATLKAQGDLSAARKLQEQVLEARRRVLGDEHPETLTARSNVALTLYERGDLAGAGKLQEQVLETSRRVLGDEHPETLTAMNNLAATLYGQGNLSRPRKLQERVLEASRGALGDDHPDTLTAMNNLAQTLEAQGDLSGARKLQEQVLEARRRVLGDEHPDTLVATNNLAVSLFEQGDLSGAQKLQEQVLEASRRVLGEQHPDTLTAMHNLAQMRALLSSREPKKIALLQRLVRLIVRMR